MNLPENIVPRLLDDELFEMANFSPQRTGLRFTVWFSGDPVQKHHRPRGKIRIEGEYYPFSLDEPLEWLAELPPGVTSADTKRLTEFVRLNRTVLMAYWNGDIDTSDLVAGLKRMD